ncbi:hypothetical protein PGH26_08845 [Sporosarcina jeotgali]|uniref:DUF420 domain-containing protein n=1 Tax=Sporosarcina jeotgali TaxID=3020056 RepID=A0ABZ0KT69_9BACL|nr:hypothetical protein [Sporosarcina sp. B2O-1]WOV83045.1 hypothetical protein PGH26_08845 [Sporosarcina sp. B2O-1]
MFKVIILTFLLISMYLLLLKEKRVVRVFVILYFTLLSVLFLTGISKITEEYHLYQGPVPDEGFRALSDWVGTFSYFFIVPVFVVVAYVTFKIAKRIIPNNRVRIPVYLLWLMFLLAVSFVSFFIFTLIFYGFAP